MADMIMPDWASTVRALYDAFQERDDDKQSETVTPVQQDENISREELLRNVFPQIRQNSICITGFHKEAVQNVKRQIHKIAGKPLALESFHVKRVTDIRDGALLVPKVILVGIHSPGRKVLDDAGDTGQLDFLYDEVSRIGADILVLYVGLPRSIYPPTRSLYHPKLAESLFPDQILLRLLASDNCFMTLTEKMTLNDIQKNLILEWLAAPSGLENFWTNSIDLENSTNLTANSPAVASSSVRPKVIPTPPGDSPIVITMPMREKVKEKKKLKKKKMKRKSKYTFEKDDDDLYRNAEKNERSNFELDLYTSLEMPDDSPGVTDLINL